MPITGDKNQRAGGLILDGRPDAPDANGTPQLIWNALSAAWVPQCRSALIQFPAPPASRDRDWTHIRGSPALRAC